MKVLKSQNLLIFILCFSVLISCATTFKITKDKNLSFKNKSLAVIAATRTKETIYICDNISMELSKQTSLKVLTKKEIKTLYPEYPLKIKGPYKFAFTSIEEDYKLSDKKRIEEIQKKLNVDYILFFWIPSVISNDTGTYLLIMQGFQKNRKKTIASGKFRLIHSGEEIILGAPGNYKKMVKSFSKNFARNFGYKTDTLK